MRARRWRRSRRRFPGVTVDGRIDRTKLAAKLVGDPAMRSSGWRRSSIRWCAPRRSASFDAQNARGARVVVLDIPLLFETGGEKRVDAVVVVSAPADVQRARVLDRPGMTAERLDTLLARQMSDADKRARAHFVVDSSRSFDSARAQVRGILRAVAVPAGRANQLKNSAMREIVFDTETTGLDPFTGDRLVEIGCIELVNGFLTGQTLPPLRQSRTRHAGRRPSRCTASRPSSSRTSRCSPRCARNSSAFIGDAPLIAHNAMFDLGFVNAELDRCKRALIARERIIDTLMLARRKHSAGPYSLDALCAALRHRQFAAHQARRAARRRAAGRGLSRADRRAAGAAQPGRRDEPERADRLRHHGGAGARDAARAAGHRGENAPRIGRSWRRSARRRSGRSTWRRRLIAERRRTPAGRAASRPSSGDRARRNRPDRSAAAGIRRCASRSAMISRANGNRSRGHSIITIACMLSCGTFWMRKTPA